MKQVEEAYNSWADQYDTNQNKTRDLEAVSLRETLKDIPFDRCLEVGCGTGKNTPFLLEKAAAVKAVDFSEEMLAKARMKVQSPKVQFIQADILQPWVFAGDGEFDLVTFCLVLEHIEDLYRVFQELKRVVRPNGHVYIGELHPFKQYTGSKARFETEEGLEVVTCFNHNISDFIESAKKHGFGLAELKEYFDDNDRSTIPRILTLVFKNIIS